MWLFQVLDKAPSFLLVVVKNINDLCCDYTGYYQRSFLLVAVFWFSLEVFSLHDGVEGEWKSMRTGLDSWGSSASIVEIERGGFCSFLDLGQSGKFEQIFGEIVWMGDGWITSKSLEDPIYNFLEASWFLELLSSLDPPPISSQAPPVALKDLL